MSKVITLDQLEQSMTKAKENLGGGLTLEILRSVDNEIPETIGWRSVWGNDLDNAVLKTYGISDKVYITDENGNVSPVNLPVSKKITDIKYFSGKFIMVGADNTVLYSSDRNIWNQSTIPISIQNIDGGLEHILLTNKTYSNMMAVHSLYESGSNKAAYSTNGIDWSSITLPVNDYWIGISCNSNTYYILSDNGLLLKSKNNGRSWTQSNLPTNTYYSIAAPGVGTSQIVHVLAADGLYRSTNSGEDWEKCLNLKNISDTNQIYQYNKTVVLILSNEIYVSLNEGLTFTHSWFDGPRGVIFGGSNIPYIVSSNKIYSSNDGINWTSGKSRILLNNIDVTQEIKAAFFGA